MSDGVRLAYYRAGRTGHKSKTPVYERYLAHGPMKQATRQPAFSPAARQARPP